MLACRAEPLRSNAGYLRRGRDTVRFEIAHQSLRAKKSQPASGCSLGIQVAASLISVNQARQGFL
jgi:hypothetical protein